ncbi:MAG: hypothetical protein JNL96_07815 [Planctomycetaceae bacterium]|nr:hypothetical protein [Planctomycetaceae bacterium]
MTAEPDPQLVATAYHEAGHAVMSLELNRPIERISIAPKELRSGYCKLHKSVHGPLKDAVETEVLILLGGVGAEARHTGDYDWEAGSGDLRLVRELLNMQPSNDRALRRQETRLLDKMEHILDQPGVWTAVERIAKELLRETSISGRAARELHQQAKRQARD